MSSRVPGYSCRRSARPPATYPGQVLETLEPGADEVYAVALVPSRHGPVGRVLLTALDLWCAISGGSMELSGSGYVEVSERHGGRVALRLPVETATVAAWTLDQVRADLASLTPEEFRAEWGVD